MFEYQENKKIFFFYKILTNKKLSDIITCLRIFYKIKLHPEYTRNIKKINFFSYLKKIINKIFFVIFECPFILIYKNQNKFFKKKDVLILSHLVDGNDVKNNYDFYFGNLETFLKKKNISYQYLLFNHTKFNSNKLNTINKKKTKHILENLLSLRLEIKFFFSILKGIIFIIKNKKIFKKYVNYKEVLLSLFNNETIHAIRTKHLIKQYIKKCKPKYLITTFEGFPWERQVFKAAKECNPNIKTIGYQQVFLTKNYKSIFFKLSKDYNPDIIWTTGRYAKKLFLNSDLKKKKIIVTGKLNNNSLNQSKKIIKKNNYCLVAPEGIISECIKLFNFSILVALKNNNIKFIWRLHPVIDIKKILKNLKIKKNQLPKNIKISNNRNIFNDIKNCKFILYRGSSVVIDAVEKNTIPIYLEFNNEINIDILLKYKKIRNSVSNEADFIKVIKKYNRKKNYVIKCSKIFLDNKQKINFKEITRSLT